MIATVLMMIAALALGATTQEDAPERRARLRLRTIAPKLLKDGWWVRIDPKTAASELQFRIGATPKESVEVTWVSKKNPDEFDVPIDVRGADSLHLSVAATPDDAAASFCVFFRDQGVELFELRGKRAGQVTQQRREKRCVP